MPYNLTMDVPSNRAVVERLREMDEFIDLRPQYVATNIQPDHFPDRMMVGGVMDRQFLQMGTNNRNTPYNHFATMATPSAGRFTLKGAVKSVAKVAKPVAKYTYKEIVQPVAREVRKEGTKQAVGLAKELLKEAIMSAMESSAEGAGRKPRGKGRKPRSVGGNVYPSASVIHSSQRSAGEVGNIASVVRPAVQMNLPSDSMPIVPFVGKRGRGRPCGSGSGGSSGGGSGGKFNLKNALKKTGKVAKSVAVIAGREALPLAIGALGQEFGVPMPVGMAVGRMISKGALSENVTGVKGSGKKPKMIACGGGDGRAKRAEIVKKVMKEKGLKMIEASKYVKANGLY
jgi:hypothetical protein